MKEYLLLGELLFSHNWRSLASEARCNMFSLEIYARTQYTHKPCVQACSQLRVFWSVLDGSRVSEALGTLLACRERFHKAGQ